MYFGTVVGRMGERNGRTEKCVGPGLALDPCSVHTHCSCPVFRLWRLVLPGRGESVGKSEGHVTHFSITQRISGAKPKVFNNIGQANLFFST